MFADRIGVAKKSSTVDMALLEYCIREDLNKRARRYMAVLDPLKVVIENYPEGQTEELDAVNNPEDESAGTRKVPFGRELYIQRSDFMEDPPRKFFRLAPGREVRLRWAYFIKCEEVIKDADGNITELRCTYDPETKGGNAPDGRKVKGTIHWVSAEHCFDAEVRLYDTLFTQEDPADVPEGTDWKENINPDSLRIVRGMMEPALKGAAPGDMIQFERVGYFTPDSADSKPEAPVFNRTVTLRDTWAKIKKQKQQQQQNRKKKKK
jgi:glutaminyl-tRNA synthetase